MARLWENDLSASGLGREAGIGGVAARWEKFYLNLFPSRRELESLAKVVQVDGDCLRQMLPPEGVGMKHEPIYLCGVCYAQSPCHKIEWQFKTTTGCDLPLAAPLASPPAKFTFRMSQLWSKI